MIPIHLSVRFLQTPLIGLFGSQVIGAEGIFLKFFVFKQRISLLVDLIIDVGLNHE